MDRFGTQRRVNVGDEDGGSPPPRYDAVDEDGEDISLRSRPSEDNTLKNVQRGDYVHVPFRPRLMKILQRQGDKQILFADKVLKFTGTGKMKRRILVITDFAIYLVDPDTNSLKRRIALAAVEKICLSKLSDNFFAIIIPTEYDLLMANTRKNEIVDVLVGATKSASDYELEIVSSNSFEYHAAADSVKEIQFEEVEAGVKTRILRK